jgi:hypothetical protein
MNIFLFLLWTHMAFASVTEKEKSPTYKKVDLSQYHKKWTKPPEVKQVSFTKPTIERIQTSSRLSQEIKNLTSLSGKWDFSKPLSNPFESFKIYFLKPLSSKKVTLEELPKLSQISHNPRSPNSTKEIKNLTSEKNPSEKNSQEFQGEKPLYDLSPFEYKMLQAELATESQQYPLALGLYLELLKDLEKQDSTKPTASDHQKTLSIIKNLSHLALKLDLYHDFKKWSFHLLEHSFEVQETYEKLTHNVRSYDEDFIEEILPFEKKFSLSPSSEARQYRLLKAQILSRKDQLKEALAYLETHQIQHLLDSKILFLKSVLFYRLGQTNKALTTLEPFIEELSQSDVMNTEMKNESWLLLARLYFQKGDYAKARSFYSKLDQTYIEWLTAMTEMGWAQILEKDYEGASGNMFSLHSDYFKHHFIPESYLARTVGYLGLCQYGDALKTVFDLKSRYTPLMEKTSQIKDQWGPESFYELIPKALQNSKLPEVNGVPRPWISLLTRDPNFIREQKIINALEDETNSYNRFTLKIIQLEKESLALKQNLLKKSSLSQKEKDDLYWINIKLHIYKKSREHMRVLRSQGLERIDHLKTLHKKLAGLALKQKMIETHQSILTAFEQLDLLQYEIFSGAGEQLRSLLSGLPIDPKSFDLNQDPNKPASIKWDFKGEVWKDEIGYFRSSLKNICQEGDSL